MMLIFADAGVPMLFPQVVLMGLAFVPVVLIETFLVRRSVTIPLPRTLRDVTIANLWSTLLGVPLAWLAMLFLEVVSTANSAMGMDSPAKTLAAVTLQAAWLIPYEEHLFWMIPCAATVLLIPCFVVSVFIEHLVLARCWKEKDPKTVFFAVLRANVWSYLFLFAAGSLWIVSSSH
jgi:hypothetical protein